MSKKVVVAKIGTTVSLRKHSQRNAVSAPYELCKTIEVLSTAWKDHEFIIIGPNDLEKMSEEEYKEKFPNGNVSTRWKSDMSPENMPDCSDCDYAMLFGGISSKSCRSNYFYRANGSGEKIPSLVCFDRYSAPAYWAVNNNRLPWIYLGLDARHIDMNIGRTDDMLIPPSIIGTLFDVEGDKLSFSYSKFRSAKRMHNIKRSYTIPAKLCYQMACNVFREKMIPFDLASKTRKMVSMNNQNCSGSIKDKTTDRWDMTMRYFFNEPFWTPDNCDIVGDWNSYFKMDKWSHMKSNPMFKGNIDPRTRIEEVSKYKYSTLFSMSKGMSSAKWFEMVLSGVIPFMAEDYDTSCLFEPADHFSRVSTPEELIKKVKLLEMSDKAYVAAIEKLREAYPIAMKTVLGKFLSFMKEAEARCEADFEATRNGQRFVEE